MNANLIAPFIEGFKDSIRLSISIFVGAILAIASVFSSFTNHTLGSPKTGGKPEMKVESH